MAESLTARFYRRPTELVACSLLGKVLVHGTTRARITECEAYLGPEDLASHARFGRTARSDVMYQAGGCAYVYLCYGMHNMFNVVTGMEDEAGAVLIRAARILEGGAKGAQSATDGPGKLTRALGLSLRHNRADLTSATNLYVSSGRGSQRVSSKDIQVGPRVGVDYAGKWAKAPLRFRIS